MKPSSEDYITYVDKQGTTRRKYKTFCIECGIEKYTQKSKVNIPSRCRPCATKLTPSEEVKKKISETLRNKYATDAEWKRKVVAAQNVAKGSKHWNWKGGITPINQRTRTSEDYSAWRLAVLHRDHYKCRVCEDTQNLHAHHINPWSAFPEDRYVLQNGLTLCATCHKNYHDYEREVMKNANQA